MAHGDFVWCDLSARQTDIVCSFYNSLLRWQYHTDTAPDGSEYHVAYTDNPVGGLYTMPSKFNTMGMPCFWMSYVEVSSVQSAIHTASTLGGKVEVGPISGPNGSLIALIRDPLGAGFTVIEGKGLIPRSDCPKHGEMAWNELYVSDARAVVPFYKSMFNWKIETSERVDEKIDVTINGEVRSAIFQLPDSIRGKEQFWGIHFAVDDLSAAKSHVNSNGTILYEQDDTLLARDPDNAAFFLSRT